MRIAIYHNLPSGGGKRALQEMARHLSRRHELDVLSLSCSEHAFCDLRPYARRHVVFPFQPLPLARRPFGRLNQAIRVLSLLRLDRLQRQVAAHIDANSYDLVFAHSCQFSQSPGLLHFLHTPAAYFCGEPPRAIYEPTIKRPYHRLSRLQRAGNLIDPLPGLYRRTLLRLDRRNVSHAAQVLVNSAYSRESLYRTYGIFAEVAYLGVDADRFRPRPLPKGDFVLSVGALMPHKGFDWLIRALSKIPGRDRPPLLIVSNSVDHREHDYLANLAAELGVSVSMHSLVSDDELVDLYNQARLTLYSPIMEPFGLVPVESMSCGTPVVGVAEGGVRESVVHDVTGVLTGRHLDAFAGAVGDLLHDDTRREAYARQGREHVLRQWQWETSIQGIERLLQRTGQAES